MKNITTYTAKRCVWKYDKRWDVYDSSCGSHIYLDGISFPVDAKFCMFCGLPMTRRGRKEEESKDERPS